MSGHDETGHIEQSKRNMKVTTDTGQLASAVGRACGDWIATQHSLNEIRRLIRYAVRCLAVGTGEIKSRMYHAFMEGLSTADLQLHVIPPPLRPPALEKRLDAIIRRLTHKGEVYPRCGSYYGTTHRMHRKTMAKIAEEIWILSDAFDCRAFEIPWTNVSGSHLDPERPAVATTQAMIRR